MVVLGEHPVIRGNFVQRKTIKILTRPLISSGFFVMSRSNGLYWRQTKPFLSELLVTRDVVAQRFHNGDISRYTNTEQPIISNISKIFLALWSGDIETLNTVFRIQATPVGQGWQLTLLPHDGVAKKILSGIVVQGDDYIRELEIQEHNGNLTKTVFSDISAADRLKENESGFFSWH